MLPRLVSLAQQVDCSLVVLHPPKATTTKASQWTEFIKALRRERSNADVQISMENASIFRPSDVRYLLHDLRRLRTFSDRYDVPLTFDTAHAGTSPHELLEAYQFVRGRVINVHFSDLVHRPDLPNWKWLQTLLKNHQMPGQGALPLAEFMRVLLADGYSGLITVEVSPTALKAWSRSRIREGLVQAVASVRQLEAKASRL
jgi:sugar phosphate isomerase/epimerase